MRALPDLLEIKPLEKPPHATITVPGSKSITNRALILAALSDKRCTLQGALWADDTQVMVDSLQRLGFAVNVLRDPAEECNRTIEVEGRSGKIPVEKAELYVGNAGTAARFLTALVALGHGEYTITGDARMNERPMEDLFQTLRHLGVEIETSNGHLPATIHTKGLHGGAVAVNLAHSTQFASALLLIMRPAGIQLEFSKAEMETLGYINMTEVMLNSFQPDYRVEPDYSSASYFWAAGSITRGDIKVAGWSEEHSPMQIDARFPRYLSLPPNVSRLKDLGDSVLTLAICALFGRNPLRIVEASWLRNQETNRLHAMVTELMRVGGEAKETADGFIVNPAQPGQLHGADIETYNDHRMAMCFSVLGLKIPDIRIKNPSCVSKTFPNFFDKLKQLGAELVDARTGKRL